MEKRGLYTANRLTFRKGYVKDWSKAATAGEYDLGPIVERDTILTRPLRAPEYFRSFFLELGALAWPNGLEFSPESLHRALLEAGRLQSLPQLTREA
jgi:hypothetical protein